MLEIFSKQSQHRKKWETAPKAIIILGKKPIFGVVLAQQQQLHSSVELSMSTDWHGTSHNFRFHANPLKWQASLSPLHVYIDLHFHSGSKAICIIESSLSIARTNQTYFFALSQTFHSQSFCATCDGKCRLSFFNFAMNNKNCFNAIELGIFACHVMLCTRLCTCSLSNEQHTAAEIKFIDGKMKNCCSLLAINKSDISLFRLPPLAAASPVRCSSAISLGKQANDEIKICLKTNS